MTNAFSLPAHSLLDTSGAVPQTGKPMMDFELPDSVLAEIDALHLRFPNPAV